MEALASRNKSLQGQFERAAKILSSQGLPRDNRKTLIELEKLHPKENEIHDLRRKTISPKFSNSTKQKRF